MILIFFFHQWYRIWKGSVSISCFIFIFKKNSWQLFSLSIMVFLSSAVKKIGWFFSSKKHALQEFQGKYFVIHHILYFLNHHLRIYFQILHWIFHHCNNYLAFESLSRFSVWENPFLNLKKFLEMRVLI